VEQWGLTREELDQFSVASQNKAEAAVKAGRFKDEIVPVEVPQKKGDPLFLTPTNFPNSAQPQKALQN
jgi:acetyl-CoA C-acetyltransferase